MKMLLVEDSPEKAARVVAGLQDEVSEAQWQIDHAADSNSAKRLLRNEYYDLVVLDIAIPLRAPDAADPTGGIKLYQEVLARDIYKRPGHVIGLTALADVYESSGSAFDPEMWSLIFFDGGSEVWLDRLATKVRHVISAERSRAAVTATNVDVAIVVAVPDELDQVKRNGWSWQPHEIAGDATVYFRADFIRQDGTTGKAVLARAPQMGMSAAAILVTKVGLLFKPRTIVMCGICAGDSNQVSLGDLIVANPAWDYGSGKHVGDETEDKFEPAPYQLSLSTRVRGLAERLEADGGALEAIWEAFPGQKPTARPRLHIGPFASGAAVLANRSLFTAIQDQQHRKLLGIDMEAYGVMAAAKELLYPQPEVLVLKSVSDFADSDKGDSVRHYAAHASAGAVTMLCQTLGL